MEKLYLQKKRTYHVSRRSNVTWILTSKNKLFVSHDVYPDMCLSTKMASLSSILWSVEFYLSSYFMEEIGSCIRANKKEVQNFKIWDTPFTVFDSFSNLFLPCQCLLLREHIECSTLLKTNINKRKLPPFDPRQITLYKWCRILHTSGRSPIVTPWIN
jgi:hypothetical protein